MVTLSLLFVFWVISNNNGLCTIELAQGRPATLSTIHSAKWTADKAVDGNTNTNLRCNSCTHTGIGTVASITVDLEATFAIHRIEIYFAHTNPTTCSDTSNTSIALMKERGRLYSAVISNTRSINGFPCYKDTTINKDDFDLIQNQTCEGIGRYISLVQRKKAAGDNDPLLLVCELRVYGCPVGYFGDICENQCPSNCRTCKPDNGQCWGCKPGWLEENCEIPCPDGKYGANCTRACSKCRENLPCNKENGSCPDCDRGYTGTFCESVCTGRTYGYNCNEACGSCRGGGMCDTKYGNCSSCERGYKLPLCKNLCKDGFYGYNCDESCGACKFSCDKRHGNCSGNVCRNGYYGSICKTECKPGTYGNNCSELCGSCLNNGVCDHEIGICPGSSCESGYTGAKCKDECPDGMYGYNCSQTCGFCLNNEACDKGYGICKTPLCDSGYKGLLCKDACEAGSFGFNCSEQCGYCKDNAPCRTDDGSCPYSRCKAGYKGKVCKTECDISEYGENCEYECGACKDYLCHPENGTCLNGCRFDRIPPLCIESLLQTEISVTTTAIAIGITGALVMIMLINACILIFFRRRTTEVRREETQQVYEASINPTETTADNYTTLEELSPTTCTCRPYAVASTLERIHSYIEMENKKQRCLDREVESEHYSEMVSQEGNHADAAI